MKPIAVLEKKQRLSKSMLWKLQRKAYREFGPQSSSHKGVPFYAPSYPLTVVQDVEIITTFLLDCVNPSSQTPLDLSEPVYIFDMAPGTGRYGFLFLKMLVESLGVLRLYDIQCCYVMTDISKINLFILQRHPYLQPFIKEGWLDFAYFNSIQQEEPITLIKSKKILSKETIRNPLIVIGNYFFENIPQDLFRVKKGKLEEGRVTISVNGKRGLNALNAKTQDIMPYIRCKYSYAPIENPAQYYSDYSDSSALNPLLKAYAQQFNNIPFLFPIGAFQVIQYFANLSQKRLLLLAGNQDVCADNKTAEWGEPPISKHGTFSLAVNYHAIVKYFKAHQGIGLLNTFYNPQYIVIVGILGGTINHFANTCDALAAHDSTLKSGYLCVLHYSENEWSRPRPRRYK